MKKNRSLQDLQSILQSGANLSISQCIKMCTQDLSSGGNQEAADDAEGAEEEEEQQHLWMLRTFPIVIELNLNEVM